MVLEREVALYILFLPTMQHLLVTLLISTQRKRHCIILFDYSMSLFKRQSKDNYLYNITRDNKNNKSVLETLPTNVPLLRFETL